MFSRLFPDERAEDQDGHRDRGHLHPLALGRVLLQVAQVREQGCRMENDPSKQNVHTDSGQIYNSKCQQLLRSNLQFQMSTIIKVKFILV